MVGFVIGFIFGIVTMAVLAVSDQKRTINMLNKRFMLLNQIDVEKYFTPITNYIAVKYGITFFQNNLESLVNTIGTYMIENYGYDINEWELLSLEDDIEDFLVYN